MDTLAGPVLGSATRLTHEQVLAPNEVVLTFDDGPLPWITRSILATLAQHCTRATFFSVGQMAVAYPNIVREELASGHSVATHTWSHPLNLKRLKEAKAEAEMEKGFAAVTAAAGQPISAFFRFPGLSDSGAMVAHLASRGVATVTVDVVSNDSYIHDADRLVRETLAKVDANRGGIILFHDIKATTAKALPVVLDGLAARGYHVVHLVSKQALQVDAQLHAGYAAQVARALAKGGDAKSALVPFYGTIGPRRQGQAETGSDDDSIGASMNSGRPAAPSTGTGVPVLRSRTDEPGGSTPAISEWSTRVRVTR